MPGGGWQPRSPCLQLHPSRKPEQRLGASTCWTGEQTPVFSLILKRYMSCTERWLGQRSSHTVKTATGPPSTPGTARKCPGTESCSGLHLHAVTPQTSKLLCIEWVPLSTLALASLGAQRWHCSVALMGPGNSAASYLVSRTNSHPTGPGGFLCLWC